MKKSILAILDPFEGPKGLYNFKKDSSHLLLSELARRKYAVYYTTPGLLGVKSKNVFASARRVTVLPEAPYFIFHEEATLSLKQFSLILMRKDPPVDADYLYTTQILSLAASQVPIINNPEALRNWNEKMIILNFPKWVPPTLVTANKKEIDHFARAQEEAIVIKSVNGFAGTGVFKIHRNDENYTELVAKLTEDGMKPIMVQPFIASIFRGEKRVFMLEGKLMGALLKIPAEGNFLANPDLGGHLAPTKLTQREKRLCADVGKFLKKHKIFFAGLDLIDQRLIEINITSPGLLCEWNEIENKSHEEEIVNKMEKRIKR